MLTLAHAKVGTSTSISARTVTLCKFPAAAAVRCKEITLRPIYRWNGLNEIFNTVPCMLTEGSNSSHTRPLCKCFFSWYHHCYIGLAAVPPSDRLLPPSWQVVVLVESLRA